MRILDECVRRQDPEGPGRPLKKYRPDGDGAVS
jgi:hypothetical protein